MNEAAHLALHQRYSGRVIARRKDEVVASALTFDDLADELNRRGYDWTTLTIEYIAPVNVVSYLVSSMISR
jgi:hypothetical protein